MFLASDKQSRNVLVSSDHGLMIVNRFDCTLEGKVGQSQWLLDHGNVSIPELQDTVNALTEKDIKNPIIFDIGANIGTYTSLVSRFYYTGKIYSFEPQRPVFQMLCGNIALNNLYNCYAYNIALGEQNELREIEEPNYFVNGDFGTYSLVNDVIKTDPNSNIVLTINTLDTFVKNNNIPYISFIKIDVEGMEFHVLKGAIKSLKKFNPILLIEHCQTINNVNSTANELMDYLGADKYKFKITGNNLLAMPLK